MKAGDLVRRKREDDLLEEDRLGVGVVVKTETTIFACNVGNFPSSRTDIIVMWNKHGLGRAWQDSLEIIKKQ